MIECDGRVVANRDVGCSTAELPAAEPPDGIRTRDLPILITGAASARRLRKPRSCRGRRAETRPNRAEVPCLHDSCLVER